MLHSSNRSIKNVRRRIHALNFCFALSVALMAYVFSSFLEQIISVKSIGLMFSGAYALSAVYTLVLERWMIKWGKSRVFYFFVVITIISIALLSLPIPDQSNGISYLGLFLIIAIVVGFILYNVSYTISQIGFDVALEQYSSDRSTGRTRGIFLTIMNLGWVIAPIVMGLLIENFGFRGVFVVSAICILPVLMLFSTIWKKSDDKKFEKRKGIIPALKTMIGSGLWRVFVIAFILQFFYSWMVIYTPIYLRSLGYSWGELGVIFTAMLLPFVLFEYPIGRLADRWGIEKEILIIGLIIMGVATITLSSIGQATVGVWMVILFCTRVGASVIEMARDSYFFKHVNSDNVEMIDLFRMTTPLGYVIGPLVGSFILMYYPIPILYGILGTIVLLSIVAATRLEHTNK